MEYNLFKNLEPALDPDVQKEYLIQLANGDLSKKDILIKHNLRLIVYVLKKHFLSLEKYWEDLFMVGCKKLIEVVGSYDIEKGYDFATYACKSIYYEILTYYNRKIKHTRQEKSLDSSSLSSDGREISLYNFIKGDSDEFVNNIEDLEILLMDLNNLEKEIATSLINTSNSKQCMQALSERFSLSIKTINQIYCDSIKKIKQNFLKNNNISINQDLEKEEEFLRNEVKNAFYAAVNSNNLKFPTNNETKNLIDSLLRELYSMDEFAIKLLEITFGLNNQTSQSQSQGQVAKKLGVNINTVRKYFIIYMDFLGNKIKSSILKINKNFSCKEFIITALKTKSKISRACNFFRYNYSQDKDYKKYLKTLTLQEISAVEYYFGLNGKPSLDLEGFKKEFSLDNSKIFKLLQSALIKIGTELEKEPDLDIEFLRGNELNNILNNYNDIKHKLDYLIFLFNDNYVYKTWESLLLLNGIKKRIPLLSQRLIKHLNEINGAYSLINSLNKYETIDAENHLTLMKYLFNAIGGTLNSSEWVFSSSLKVFYQNNNLLELFYNNILKIEPKALKNLQESYGLYSSIAKINIKDQIKRHLKKASKLFNETNEYTIEKINMENNITFLKLAASMKIGNKKAFYITPNRLEKNVSSPKIDYIYPKLKNIIDNMTILERKIIILAFGFNEEESYSIDDIIDALNLDKNYKIKYYQLLSDISDTPSIDNPPKNNVFLNLIYSFYKDYPKSIIDKAILSLDYEKLMLLDDLSKIELEDYQEYLDIFLPILNKIIDSDSISKSAKEKMYEEFYFYPKELIEAVFQNLNEDYKNFKKLYKYSNIVLPFNTWKNKKANIANKQINKLIIRRAHATIKNLDKTLFKILHVNSKDEVLTPLNKLSPEDKKTIKILFPTLEEKLCSEDYFLLYKFNYVTLPKLRLFLTNSYKTIYELIPNYTKEEIDEEIEKLSDSEKHILYLRYGNDLENPQQSPEWNHKLYSKKLFTIFEKIKRRIEKKRNTSKENSKQLTLSQK